MQCLYCGKQLSVLRELTDGEFCSRQHRLRYKKLTQLALKRLTAEPSGMNSPASSPRLGAPELPVAGFRLPAGGVFRFCRPATLPGAPQMAAPLGLLVSRAAIQSFRGSSLQVGVLNTPAFRQTGPCPLPSSGTPVRAANVQPGSLHPAPMKAPLVRPCSQVLSLDSPLREARPAWKLRSQKPCLEPRKVSLAARSLPSSPLPVEAVGWQAPRWVLPQAAGPQPFLVARLRARGPCQLDAAARAAQTMATAAHTPLAFDPPPLRKPALSPVTGRPAPKEAPPATQALAGKLLPAKPLGAGSAPGFGASSLLPALASLFRYGQASDTPLSEPKPTQRVAARDRRCSPIAFGASPFAPPSLLYRRNALSIVETFEYLRPVEEPVVHWLHNLLHFWDRIPGYVRYATAGASLMLFLWAAFPGMAVADLLGSRLGRLEETIRSRAAVEITEDFKTGMQDWRGEGDWSRSWRIEKAGYVRPGKLALFEPSMKMDNYRVEFLVQIERQAVSWAYRAKDEHNYYAAKIRLVRSGPLPLFSLVRYAVVGGEPGPRVEIPIRVMLHDGVPYRVQISANGSDFSTAIEGQLVDFWRDDLFRSGGFGFFADSGERARIYWMKLSQKEDFVGRICAYFFPSALETRSAMRSQ
ncbi:MAG: hypothetical protein K6T61_14675 [Bryobacteraceae bacterium]|nr:hypothetical protein [Bryobacteraceae bacterium]